MRKTSNYHLSYPLARSWFFTMRYFSFHKSYSISLEIYTLFHLVLRKFLWIHSCIIILLFLSSLLLVILSQTKLKNCLPRTTFLCNLQIFVNSPYGSLAKEDCTFEFTLRKKEYFSSQILHFHASIETTVFWFFYEVTQMLTFSKLSLFNASVVFLSISLKTNKHTHTKKENSLFYNMSSV